MSSPSPAPDAPPPPLPPPPGTTNGGDSGSDTSAATAATATAANRRPANRLAAEQSPYLLQHAHNPVAWYPWGPEALAKAAEEDKPIFLSVGYATCHWCHVMERESFESEEIAELLNRDFVAVKVDREERPDVDRVYMSYVQAVTGAGGWPMSVWLTPQLEPFYGGTYYPPQDRFVGGQLLSPGLATVLRRIASMWRSQRQDLRDKAATTLAQLQEALAPEPATPAWQPRDAASAAASPTASADAPASAPAAPADAPTSIATAAAAASSSGAAAPAPAPVQYGAAAVTAAAVGGLPVGLAGAVVDAVGADLMRRYDAALGGFGGPPKFPRPCEVQALLRAALRERERGDALGYSRLADAALHTLRSMAAGGMYDHLGGGFHRYSVDELWHVPHFEKMLYDNTQLAAAYTAAWQLTGDRQHAAVVRGVLDYMLRDLLLPGGGLASAEDADSALQPGRASHVGEGAEAAAVAAGGGMREGAFYVWSAAEVRWVLGPDLAPLFCAVYGIQEQGNCDRSDRSDPHGEFDRLNVPYTDPARDLAAAAAAAAGLALPPGAEGAAAAAELRRRLAAAREALAAARGARPRPALDDKAVTAWQGMAIGAFATASRALAAEGQVERLFPSEGRPAPEYLAAALRVAGFAREALWDAGARRLRRSFCRGPSAVQGFADDYAALVGGLLELYEAGGGRQWLEWAEELQAVQDELFWDAGSGGYFSTADPAAPGGDPSIRIRIKDDYDGAEPTASSTAAANLLRLAAILPDGNRPQHQPPQQQPLLPYGEAAGRTLGAFGGRLRTAPLALPAMCCAAYAAARAPLRQVIIAGHPGAPDTAALLDAAHTPFAPDKVVLVMDPTDPADAAFYAARNPPAAAMVAAHYDRLQQQGGTAGGTAGAAPATAFICQNYTCLAPTGDPARVVELLGQTARPAGAARVAVAAINSLGLGAPGGLRAGRGGGGGGAAGGST